MIQLCRVLCLLLLLVALPLSADENDIFDEFDREDRPRAAHRRGPHLPPPLEGFDEDGDGMLSHEEIQSLAEKLKGLDRDGDGYVDPRELAALFRPPRPHRDNGFDAPQNGRDRGRGGDEFRRPGPDDDRGSPRGRRPPPNRFEEDFDDDDEDDGRFDRSDRRRRPPPGRFDEEGFEDDFDDDRRLEDDDEFGPREDDEFSNRRRPPERSRPRPYDDDEGAPRGAGRDRSNVDRLLDRLFRNDADGDGLLSDDEIPPKLRRHVQQADRNQDGMIDRRELEQFLSDRNR